jgi:hypothetical protein
MLDDIAVGPFLEQPAGKDAIPFVVALFLNRQLDESPGFRRRFPWRRGFAGAQADDDAPHPRTVAGAHFEIADQPVALVEEGDHRLSFGHGGRPRYASRLLRHGIGAADLRLDLRHGTPAIGALVASGKQRDQRRRTSGGPQAHSAPGRHAS